MPEATEIKVPLSYESYLYMDVTPGQETEKYELMGEGITSLTPTQNPQTTTQQYIHEINSTTTITALQKQFAYAGERAVGDPVNDFLASLEDKVGSSLQTTIIVCNGWDSAATPEGALKAKKYTVVIAVSNTGDRAGGSTQAISGTIYVNGDPVEGTFSPSTKTFTPTAA